MKDGIDDRLLSLEQRMAELERRLAPEQTKPTGKASRMTADWQPDENLLAWAEEKVPDVDERTERDKFRDYWIARGETRRDWTAGYRNWLRKEAEFSKAKAPVLRWGSRSRTADIDQVNRERRDRVADKLATLWRKPT